jgi:enterochelin esterase-like enzyme
MQVPIRRLLLLSLPVIVLLGAGAAVLLAVGTQVAASAATTTSTTVRNAPTPTTGPVPTSCSGPTVNSDATVTFCLTAPQASNVELNLQNDVGPSPAATAYPMTKTASGIWYVTTGPLDPNWYGYGFILDGVNVADPANRNIWSGATSAWSFVFVPGPAANYMADNEFVPHGAWATVRYYSRLTHTERQMQVYTPPGYNHNRRDYPVLYLMHGGGGNDTDWIVNMRANYIMDNLIAEHEVRPMIVVMPDGNVQPSLPFLTYSVPQDIFPQELLGSIIPFIDAHYRALPGARNRAMAGLSLGGLWTLDTLLQDPGTFAYMGVFSSGWFQGTRDDLVQNHSDLLTDPAIDQQTKLLWISVGGPQDIAYDNNFATLALFNQYHIKYTFVQGTGGHIWNTWRHDLLEFAPLLFR